MITSLTDWVAFLRSSDTLIGLPLTLGGLALMLFGWRLWRGCMVLSFGLIGMGVASYYTADDPNQLYYSLGAGVILAFISYWPVNYSIAMLGGLIGGAFIMHMLEGMGFYGPLLWVLAGAALVAGAGLAFINRQLVVIAVTAFEGAVLLVSGIAALMMTMPALYGTFASHAAFIIPFGLLVPTVMSCFYQVSEIHKIHKNL